MTTPTMAQRLGAEFLGTFWLVFGGCGAAIFSATFLSPVSGGAVQIGIGFLGVALAFGLTVVTMAYAVGHISGAHFNPAVTIGVAVAKRFEWKDVPAYVITQVAAGLLAGTALYGIANGKAGFDATGHMAANGYGTHSPGGYSLTAVLVAEVLLTAIFVYVILGVTDSRAPEGFAPLAIGLTLTIIHL
ncbi:MAG: aquaporin, partial [Ornithinibacter sp.]